MSILSDPQTWASLLMLIVLEIVLGIDNLVFLTIVSSKLPQKQQRLGRQIGLILALVLRLVLLAMVNWIAHLSEPLLTIWGQAFSARGLLLLGGGLFLLVKGTNEIHMTLVEVTERQLSLKKKEISLLTAVIQISLLDLVFSFDSVITAVGMATEFIIMATAIIVAIIVMLFASEPLGKFIDKYPSLRMLALSFLILIGAILVADGFDFHVPRGYIYFAFGFSMAVEVLNILGGRRRSD